MDLQPPGGLCALPVTGQDIIDHKVVEEFFYGLRVAFLDQTAYQANRGMIVSDQPGDLLQGLALISPEGEELERLDNPEELPPPARL